MQEQQSTMLYTRQESNACKNEMPKETCPPPPIKKVFVASEKLAGTYHREDANVNMATYVHGDLGSYPFRSPKCDRERLPEKMRRIRSALLKLRARLLFCNGDA